MSTKCWPADDWATTDELTPDDAFFESEPALEHHPVCVTVHSAETVEAADILEIVSEYTDLYVRGVHQSRTKVGTAVAKLAAPTTRNILAHMAGSTPSALQPDVTTLTRIVLGRNLARNEPLEVADPDLGNRLVKALDASTTDFRTIASLADELGVAQDAVQHELNRLGDKVRRPLGQESRYPTWYRLASRGPTRQERMGRLKAIFGFTAMDDDF